MTKADSHLRVAIVCRVLWNGGVQRTAIAQTEILRKLGIPTDLYFLRVVMGTAFRLPAGTIVMADFPVRTSLARIQLWITSLFARHRGRDASVDLDRLIAFGPTAESYSVVVYNDQYAALLGMWKYLRGRQPYVMMFHEFFPRVRKGPVALVLNPIAALIDIVSILVAPAIVTTAAATRDRLERIAEGKTWLARLGAPDPTELPPPPPRRDRQSIFSITVWDRGRHPEIYVELARQVPSFHIILAGMWTDPAHLAEVKALAKDVPNLEITGPVSEAERQQREGEAWLYLRFGFAESGPGMGGLEALARGSIVLCNRGLGLSEIIEDGLNGFVLSAPDPAEAARLLRRIEQLPDARLHEISAAALATARAHSWLAHGSVLVEAIEAAVRAPGSHPHYRT